MRAAARARPPGSSASSQPRRDDRPDQLQVQRQERDQLAEGHRVVRDGDHAAPGDAGEDQLRSAFEQRPEPAERADLGQLGAAQPLRVAGEHREHVRTAAVGLDHPDAERGLLDRGGEVAGEVLGAARLAAVAQLEAAGEHAPAGSSRRARTGRAGRGCGSAAPSTTSVIAGVGDQEHEAEADEAPQRRQVGGQPRQQLARRPAVVEGRPAAAAGGRTGRAACRSRCRARPWPSRGGAGRSRPPRRCRAQREPDERPQPGRVVVADRAVDDRADHERDERLGQHRRSARRRSSTMIGAAVRAGPPPQPQQRLGSAASESVAARRVAAVLGEVGHVDLRYDARSDSGRPSFAATMSVPGGADLRAQSRLRRTPSRMSSHDGIDARAALLVVGLVVAAGDAEVGDLAARGASATSGTCSGRCGSSNGRSGRTRPGRTARPVERRVELRARRGSSWAWSKTSSARGSGPVCASGIAGNATTPGASGGASARFGEVVSSRSAGATIGADRTVAEQVGRGVVERGDRAAGQVEGPVGACARPGRRPSAPTDDPLPVLAAVGVPAHARAGRCRARRTARRRPRRTRRSGPRWSAAGLRPACLVGDPARARRATGAGEAQHPVEVGAVGLGDRLGRRRRRAPASGSRAG